MKVIEVEIRNKKYIIKQSFRSYLLYEEMTGRQIGEVTSMKDVLTLLYCTLKGCNKDFEYSFDEYIDIIDEDPTIFDKFNEFNLSVIDKPNEKKRTVKG